MYRRSAEVLGFLTALVVSGCASTPQEVISEGPRTEHEVALAPYRAAGCIARNAENLVDSIQAPMRPMESGERYEVVIRNLNSSIKPILMVGTVEPRASGSRVIFNGPGYGLSPPRHEFVASLIKGC